MRDIHVVILAAGQGTRMRSSTPKVLHTICGKEMLAWILQTAQNLSSGISVVLSHKIEEIKNQLGSELIDIDIIEQDIANFPGTGGALKTYSPSLDTLILNGDMPLIDADEIKKLTQIDADIVMSVIRTTNPNGYGRVIIKNGEVQRVVEQKDATHEELQINEVNGGVYFIKKEVIESLIPQISNQNAAKEYYLTDIIELAKKSGKTIKPVYVNEENFLGVNDKANLSLAEEIMQERIKNKWMHQGVVFRLPQTTYIDASVRFVGECIIENSVTLVGETTLTNAHIKANSVVESSNIQDSSIGPLARIRPHSKITNSHIGNFVEVKKSTLDGVKAGHLSYLGDSEIAEGTNVGCGTITCNYDGKKKYTTKIGKNVFIGSDTQFVAPVVIEDDVIIAAGSTVTKDVPKGSLFINRAGLKIIKDFYYRFFG